MFRPSPQPVLWPRIPSHRLCVLQSPPPLICWPQHTGHSLLTLDGPRTPALSSGNQNPRSLQGAVGWQLILEASPLFCPRELLPPPCSMFSHFCAAVLFHPNVICRRGSVLQAAQTLQPAVWAPCQLVTVSSRPLFI